MLQRFTLIITTLLLTFSAFAQNTIKLNGRILNEKNEPVSGATILIEGTGKGNPADVEGRFFLNLEPGKKYTIIISAVNYETKKINDIEVGENLDNNLEVVLVLSKKTELGGVTVTASSRRQENTNALLSFQKNNTALSSGLAADFIRRTPDKNTGEILKRVSGASIQDNKFVIVRGLSDRYNSAIINNAPMSSTEPDKKAFSFDVIPAALVDNIVINKTATPEFTGEFAGGLVQINTKDVPSKNFLNAGFRIGFNTQSFSKDFVSNERNKTDWMGFDDGTRSIPSGFPGTPQAYRILGSNYTGEQQQYALTRTFNTDVYPQVQSTAGPIQEYNIAWGNAARFKDGASFGTVVSLQYRKSKLLYNVDRRLHEENGNLNIQLFDAQNKYTVNTGAVANFTYVKGKHKISFKNLFNQLFEDNFYTRTGVSIDRGQDINFYSSVLNQRTLYSGQIEGEHQLSQGIKLKWNGNGAYNWKSQPDLRTQAYYKPTGTSNPFEYNDDDTKRFYSDLKDYSYGANGSLTFPFTLGSDKQIFKVGGSTLIRIRDFNSRLLRYDVADLSQFDHAKASLPYDQIFRPENIGEDGFVINDVTNNQDKYFGASALNGMFGMFDNKFGEHIRLVWGVRVENFQQLLTTEDVTAKTVVVETEKWDVLPSMNFTYSINPKNNIRVAASRTVSRPEFREIAPFSFYDYEANYAVNGNTELKRGSIINGDIRYEFYPKAGEGISIGGFYKSFDDPIELRLDPSSVLDRRNYGYSNADEAYTVGGEIEIRKGLEFISGAMKAFSIFSNFTYSYSKVTLPSTSAAGVSVSQNRPLQGQSPYLINLGVQYSSESGIYNGSLLYNRVGQRLSLVGINDLGFPDVYENPRNQLDFQVARKVMKKRGEVKITWADIFNNDYLFYENINSEKSYQEGTDRIFSTYSPGSTLTLGFTYDFSLDKKAKK